MKLYILEGMTVVGGLLELLALYLLGKKNVWGFPVGIVSNAIWLAYMFLSESAFGLFIVCTVAIVLNVKGWRNWKAEED